jgi:hypothetical protein
MPVIAHPLDVLTLEAMKGEAGWDAALHLPLPPGPDFYLLEAARQHVISYLDWVTHDLAQGPPSDQLRHEIERATARLLEIAGALQRVLETSDRDDP